MKQTQEEWDATEGKLLEEEMEARRAMYAAGEQYKATDFPLLSPPLRSLSEAERDQESFDRR